MEASGGLIDQQAPGMLLPSRSLERGLETFMATPCLYVGVRDLKLGPHAYAASSLPTEQSPQLTYALCFPDGHLISSLTGLDYNTILLAYNLHLFLLLFFQ